jgi:hypothetical protein
MVDRLTQDGEFNDTDQHARRVSTPDLTCGSGSRSEPKTGRGPDRVAGVHNAHFLSLEGATRPETLRGEILSRCRPQLPACSTVNQCDAAHIAKAAYPAVRLRSKSASGARKAVAISQPTRSRSHRGAENMAIHYGCAEGWESCARRAELDQLDAGGPR